MSHFKLSLSPYIDNIESDIAKQLYLNNCLDDTAYAINPYIFKIEKNVQILALLFGTSDSLTRSTIYMDYLK